MKTDFVELIRRFYEMNRQELYTYALSLTESKDAAEDVIHTVFLRLLKRGKPPRELRPYVFRCVRNAAIDELRSSSRNVNNDSLFDLDRAGRNNTMGLRLQVERLLQTLSEDERECITLKIYGSMTFKEIAAIRGVSINTAASWYRRGLQKLKTVFEKESS